MKPNIIKDKYNKVINIKDKYLHQYYKYITHHLNYNIEKMENYINYLNNKL